MGKTILECKDIFKSFNGKDIVLKGVSLRIRKGDFLSILGESGSGKSTLLTILGGMDFPDQGSVFFDGMEMNQMKEKDLAVLRRTKLGFVFQFFNLAPYLSVRENILLPIILDGKSVKKFEPKLNELLEYLKLTEYASKMPTELSGGEQQRVAIARGLIYEPEIIFLDEPTGNLDSKNSEEIMTLLSQINKGKDMTIIQVTHSEHNALFGNRIVRIKDGEIIEEKEIIKEVEEENEGENVISDEGILPSESEQFIEVNTTQEETDRQE